MFETAAKLIQKYRKKKMPLKNTYDILRLINIISSVLGFRIFEYPQGHSRPKHSFLYVTILCCIYYSGWYYHGRQFNGTKFLNLHELLFNIKIVMYQVTIFVILIVGLYQTELLKKSTKRIHEIDVTLQELGSPPSFNIIYRKMIAMLLYVILYEIINTLSNIYVNHSFTNVPNKTLQEVSSSLVHLYGGLVQLIMVIGFLVIMSCIESEFQRANNLLKNYNVLPLSSIAMELFDLEESNDSRPMNKRLFPSSNVLFTLQPSSQRLHSHLQLTSHEIIRSRRLLQTIRQIHLELYRVLKSIGMIYGVQISMVTGLVILDATFFLYTLYDMYNQHDAYNSIFLAVITLRVLAIFVANALMIIGINSICEKTSREAEKTNGIVYTFFGHSTDHEIHKEMAMFSLQMMQCRQSYSAFSLYSLNYKNICSCIGIITTYTIFIQQEATE